MNPKDIRICTKTEVPFNEFFTLLKELSQLLPIPLETRMDITKYAYKIYDLAEIYFVKTECKLAGLVAIYMNDFVNFKAYLSMIGVITQYQGMGLGKCLLAHGISEAKKRGMKTIQLEVYPSNISAIRLYESFGLHKNGSKGESLLMNGTIQ